MRRLFAGAFCLWVELRVECVKILGIQAVRCDAQPFAKAIREEWKLQPPTDFEAVPARGDLFDQRVRGGVLFLNGKGFPF